MGNLAAELDDRIRALETELEHLAADRQRYADFFAFAPEAALVTDVNGTILDANVAAHALLQGAGELPGKAIDAFVPLEQRRLFQALAGVVLAGSCCKRIPGNLRLANGDIPVDFSVSAARRGRSARLIWIVRPRHQTSAPAGC